MNLEIVGNRDNDLVKILCQNGHTIRFYDDVADAFTAAITRKSGVMLLADKYPVPQQVLPVEPLNAALAAGIRVYAEYVQQTDEPAVPQNAKWERLVVAGDFFGDDVPALSILAMHGCWYLPAQAENPHLVLARVAGYRHAVYGLPAEQVPILYEPRSGLMIAASKLSNVVTGRYGPTPTWQIVWRRILTWLNGEQPIAPLSWTPAVQVQFQREEALPADVEDRTRRRAVQWFDNHALYQIDQKVGVIEGYESGIDYQGRQRPRNWPRGDCISESGLVFACEYAITGNPAHKRTATQLLDYVWSPDFTNPDPNAAAYGLNNWFERGPAFYGDDNARVILSTLAAAQLLDEDRWDDFLLRCTLANLRTTGPNGFRPNRIDENSLIDAKNGWQHYWEQEVFLPAPHYQATLWAVYLWVYALTGFEPLRQRASSGLAATMAVYPNLQWTNGIVQEYAKLLWALAYLVRVDDTPQHRQWLQRVTDDLLAQIQPCGALLEKMGSAADGRYGAPESNEAYGTREAPLIQENGNPVCDLLYSANFALVALHETAPLNDDQRVRQAEDSLARFLCRIQVQSTDQPYLNGCWMRGFDLDLWEYWGSSADCGWGAWCVESGWTNSWIAILLALRESGQTLWNLDLTPRLREKMAPLAQQMFAPPKPSFQQKQNGTTLRVPGSEQAAQ
ncbi:MAG: hypothetical protein JW936_05435 [Sedimentisphaerales bacterium]|nr:hypothetical protein [Sedimentisphaerales bacterium]